ncbi:MAG: hypothetical protein U0996_21405 [Planctomycetaceae bacterium]
MPARVSTILALVLASGLLAQGELWAQTETGNTRSGAQPGDVNAEVRRLVAQLESPDFAQRNAAKAGLLKLEEPGLTVLLEIAKTATGETQNQLTVIIEKLQTRFFEAPVQAFLKAPSADKAATLPGWTRIRALVESEDSAVLVFGEMLEAEPAVFRTLRFNPNGLPSVMLDRSIAVEKLMKSDSDQFPVASVLTLMVAGTEPGIRLTGVTQSNINVALSHPQFHRLVKNGIHAPAIASITEHWLLREHNVLDAELLFAMKLESPAGIELSRWVLKSRRTGPVECWALLTLGKMKDVESLPLIEASMNSQGRFWPARGQSVQNAMPGSDFAADYRVQASDVALAVAVYLREESLEAVGLNAARSEETLFQPHSLGFNSDDERAKAIESYRSRHPLQVAQ